MNKQPITPKGWLLGVVLLALAVLSTLCVFSLRPETEKPSPGGGAETLPETTTE